MKKGYTHIYYGDGKGKTSAALGLALRASGHGQKVVIVFFLKDWKCGEFHQLKLLPNITFLCGNLPGGKFVYEMSDDEKAETKIICDGLLSDALDLFRQGECELLILDEALDAYQIGVLDPKMFETLLNNKPENLELVVTGHKPDSRLLEHADYITEMAKRKHPYDEGVGARKGIEF